MAKSPWRPNTWSIRTPKWKLVVTKSKEGGTRRKDSSYQMELYDLQTDPYEIENKVEEFPELAQTLFQKIEATLLNNPKTVKDYYEENDFEYKGYLRKRRYPFRIMLKVKLLRLINYELNYRLKLQIMRLLQYPGIHEIVQIMKRLVNYRNRSP